MRVVSPGMVPDIPEYTGHLPPPSTHTARTHLSTVLLMPRLEARLWKMWLTLKQKQPPYTKNTVIWKIIVIKNGSHKKVLPLKSYFEIAIERHFFLTCGGNSHSFMIKWFVKGVWGTRIVSGCQWQTLPEGLSVVCWFEGVLTSRKRMWLFEVVRNVLQAQSRIWESRTIVILGTWQRTKEKRALPPHPS